MRILFIKLIEYLYLKYCLDYLIEQEEQKMMKDNGLKNKEELYEFLQDKNKYRPEINLFMF